MENEKQEVERQVHNLSELVALSELRMESIKEQMRDKEVYMECGAEMEDELRNEERYCSILAAKIHNLKRKL